MNLLDLIRRKVQPEGARPEVITRGAARQSGAMLSPGRHVVDGRTVDLPADARPLVLHPLSPGRHVIDDRVVTVENIPKRMPVE